MKNKIIGLFLLLIGVIGIDIVNAENIRIGLYNTEGMNITILNDKEMTILSGDGYAVIEDTKGTYKIENNKLIYTRIYNAFHDGNDITWQNCNALNKECGDIESLTEEFTIVNQDTLKTETYMNAAGRVSKTLTLIYQNNNANITNQNSSKEETVPENPKTGSFIPLTCIGFAGLASGIIYYVIKKKNKIYNI